MSCETLPPNVKGLFPKENLDFAHTVTPEEAEVLKEVFNEYDCFDKVGEMIDAVESKSSELGTRMRDVLEQNKKRLQGLSEAAIDYSKEVVNFVTHVMCHMTMGKDVCFKKAEELHQAFEKLSPDDQAALKKNNPDVEF